MSSMEHKFHWELTNYNPGAELGLEEFPPELEGGKDAEEALAQSDEGRQQHHRVWSEVVRLELVELEEGTEEAARRQAKAAQAV